MSITANWKAQQRATVVTYDKGAAANDAIGESKPTLAVALEDQIQAARKDGRKISAADAKAAAVARFNSTNFIAPHGTGVAVFTEKICNELGRPVIVPMTLPAFKELHRSDITFVPDEDGGAPKAWQTVDIWNTSLDRRRYVGGVGLFPNGTCPPDTYNLYRGWGVEPSVGNIDFLLGYIESLLCSGNPKQYEYLLNWLAYCVQYPERQAEVAVVLRGGKGVGKSTLGRLMVLIFGSHGIQITHSAHLMGRFNGHLRAILLVFADEAFFAGDKDGESVLKGIITEEYRTNEDKGFGVIQVKNRLKIIMASNAEWVVPASGDERRFFVLEVSNERQGDHKYWRELNEHINNGGAEAFLDYLLTRNISKFNVRDVPQTTGLAKQKLQTLGALDSFLFDCLSMGSIDGQTWDDDRLIEVQCSRFTEILTEYCQKHARHRYGDKSPRYVGLHIGDMVGATKGQQAFGNRARCYRLPSLNEARATFVKWAKLGDDFQWEVGE